MKKYKKSLLSLCIVMLTSSAVFAQQQASLTPTKSPSLTQIMAENVKADTPIDASAEVPLIRAEALREAALGLGARSGLAYRLEEIGKSIDAQKEVFDKSFNFNRLALAIPRDPSKATTGPAGDNGELAMVLPPILLDGRDADSSVNTDELRIADRIYKIHQKAKLVPVDKKTGIAAVPNWRDYLVFSLPAVQMPHHALLPKNDAEKVLWNQWVKVGWAEGIGQAESLFEAGFARLKRDFHGMLKARLAVAQGVLTVPQVAGVNLGITGGGNEMRLNDRIIRITDHATLVPDDSKWSTKVPD